MARTRNQGKPPTESKPKAPVSGPTTIRAAPQNSMPDPPTPPRMHEMPIKKNGSLKMLKTINTHYLLHICAQPGVAIVGDLEKDIRALKSPSNNFIWGDADMSGIGKTFDGDKPQNFRITVIHNEDNHNGNVCQATIDAFCPTLYDQRDLMAEEEEVISIDEIVAEIRSWTTKVKSCGVMDKMTFSIPASESKGGFPNGMANKDRYPAPWDDNWESRLAEREEKRVRYEAELAAKKTKEQKTTTKRKIVIGRRKGTTVAQLDGAEYEDDGGSSDDSDES